MPYLNLFRAGSLPSFTRLAITPGPPAAGQYWRLRWEAADQALVLPGEHLCAFSAETGSDTLTVVAPVPGRLQVTVPAGRFLEPETTVGELHYGAALEAEFRRAAAAAEVSGGPDAAALAAERAQLAADTQAAERELAALRERLAALQDGGRAPAAAASAMALGEFLPRLLEAVTRLSRQPGWTLDVRTRLRLLELLAPLRAALTGAGLRRRPRRPSGDQELHRAIAALDRLYSDRLPWAASDPPGLPATLEPTKLAIWKALHERHLAKLWEQGLPADAPGVRDGGK